MPATPYMRTSHRFGKRQLRRKLAHQAPVTVNTNESTVKLFQD